MLFFSGAAVIVIAPADNITAQEGNTVFLTCAAYGSPQPDIAWFRGGENVTNSSRANIYLSYQEEGGVLFSVSILEICGVAVEDAGTYSCRASNENGTDVHDFAIAVIPKGQQFARTAQCLDRPNSFMKKITPKNVYCKRSTRRWLFNIELPFSGPNR